MILDLKGVFECEGFRQDFSYEFGMDEYQDQSGRFPFKTKTKVVGFVRNKSQVVGLHVETECDYHTQCDRCCVDLCEHIAITFDNVLVKQLAGDGGSEDLIVVDKERFNVDELAYTNIILSLPMKHLCSESCYGLCPKCGKNLNEGSCKCVLSKA